MSLNDDVAGILLRHLAEKHLRMDKKGEDTSMPPAGSMDKADQFSRSGDFLDLPNSQSVLLGWELKRAA